MKKHNIIFYSAIFIVSLLSIMSFCNGLFVKSLLLDEALFARNINVFPDGMFISSAAPSAPLFYLATWGLIQVVGDFEWVYKLIPIISALLSMYLLFIYLKARFSKLTVFISYTLFVFSVTFIHYASNAHPFITDLFFCLWLFLLTQSLIKQFTVKSLTIWIVAAILALLTTFPAFFYVPTWGLIIVLYHYRTELKAFNYKLFLWFAPLAIAMAFLYLYFYKNMASSHVEMFDYTEVQKFTDSTNPAKIFKHFFSNTHLMLGYFFWNYQSGLIGLFLAMIGFVHYLNKKQYEIPWLMCAIGFVIIVVNLMHKWPIGPTRTMLFVMPLFSILFAGAFDTILNLAKTKLSRIVVVVALLSLLVPESWIIKNAFAKIEDSEEAVRSLRNAIVDNVEEDDVFIVYYAAAPQFLYYFRDYLERAVLHSWDIRGDNQLIQEEMSRAMKDKPGRYWLFFSHFVNEVDETSFMIKVANQYATQLDDVIYPGCRAVLFQVEDK